MKLHLCPVYSVLLYTPFCPLLAFSDFIILYVLLSPLQNTCPLGSTQALHSCSVFSYFHVCQFLSVPNRLSCLSLLSCLSCLYFPEQPLHFFTLLLPARHPAQRSSYFQPLYCPLLSVLSPVLSVTTDLFCQGTLSKHTVQYYSTGFYFQILQTYYYLCH
jgi:hypothetical protein